MSHCRPAPLRLTVDGEQPKSCAGPHQGKRLRCLLHSEGAGLGTGANSGVPGHIALHAITASCCYPCVSLPATPGRSKRNLGTAFSPLNATFAAALPPAPVDTRGFPLLLNDEAFVLCCWEWSVESVMDSVRIHSHSSCFITLMSWNSTAHRDASLPFPLSLRGSPRDAIHFRAFQKSCWLKAAEQVC